ncbi:MAG: aldo/keto reductase [Planctomycetales bacterium]|nr:aldo/keto reductase [Planctomycetales bacterium]
MNKHNLCRLGNSDLTVSRVGFGCWPISGVSSLDVNDPASVATLERALRAGINFFDTAYSYGYEGEADKLLAQVLAKYKGEAVIASKVGTYFDEQRNRVVDGHPDTLLQHAQEILHRLRIPCLDLLYLHQPDPMVPIEQSASAIAEAIQRGWARYAGVSNVNLEQLKAFHNVCPVVAVQPPFNMFQQQSVNPIREFCRAENIGIVCYWVLMKGLLAGAITREHQFDPRDRRLTYSIFQGQARENGHLLLELLGQLATEKNCSTSQLVVAWTLHQPQISVALCGAKRPEQIADSALGMGVELSSDEILRIDRWISDLDFSSVQVT